MATAPRYVAQKVGDQYVMVRTDTPMGCEDMGWMTAGSLFVAAGLLRRGTFGYASLALGAGLFYRGITGQNPFEALGMFRRGKLDTGPTFQNDVKPVEQTPDDAVDEASMESFPASDPPAKMTPASTAV